MNRSQINRMRRRAFSLLEVLMVIVILGILAAFVVPQFMNVQGRAEEDVARQNVEGGFGGAIDLYRVHMGTYPEELIMLVEAPEDEELAKTWSGPYLEEQDLQDPWGSEYQYAAGEDAEENPGKYDLSSAGRDQEFGTEDDITNWTEE